LFYKVQLFDNTGGNLRTIRMQFIEKNGMIALQHKG